MHKRVFFKVVFRLEKSIGPDRVHLIFVWIESRTLHLDCIQTTVNWRLSQNHVTRDVTKKS